MTSSLHSSNRLVPSKLAFIMSAIQLSFTAAVEALPVLTSLTFWHQRLTCAGTDRYAIVRGREQ
jgi:hypothetical protein